MVAMPPPNQRVKPMTWIKSHKARIPTLRVLDASDVEVDAEMPRRRVDMRNEGRLRIALLTAHASHPLSVSASWRLPNRLSPHHLRNWLAAGISGLKVMPMIYPVFSLLPAPEDFSA